MALNLKERCDCPYSPTQMGTKAGGATTSAGAKASTSAGENAPSPVSDENVITAGNSSSAGLSESDNVALAPVSVCHGDVCDRRPVDDSGHQDASDAVPFQPEKWVIDPDETSPGVKNEVVEDDVEYTRAKVISS